eukprot:366546-Chlamydomonas_euryale.AAC.59
MTAHWPVRAPTAPQPRLRALATRGQPAPVRPRGWPARALTAAAARGARGCAQPARTSSPTAARRSPRLPAARRRAGQSAGHADRAEGAARGSGS